MHIGNDYKKALIKYSTYYLNYEIFKNRNEYYYILDHNDDNFSENLL